MEHIKSITDMQAGKVGVHLVCADLILKGYIAFPSEEALPYDIVAEIHGKLIKIQVKTTRIPVPIPQRCRKVENAPVYLFQIMRMGKGGKKKYSDSHNDLFALVALDRNLIAYVSHSQAKTTMMFRLKEFEGNYYGDKYMKDRTKLEELRAKNHDISYREMGRVLGLGDAYVSRVWKLKNKPQYKWRSLEDFTLEKCLEALVETVL